MKCPACWTEKAYRRQTTGWKAKLLASALLLPMKCHHCYHRFYAFRLFAIGKRVHPPTLRISPATLEASISTGYKAAGPASQRSLHQRAVHHSKAA